MNKISINTMDNQEKYEFTSCILVTPNYSTKLKKNQLHSPSAAKVIVQNHQNIKAFILRQPIISVDANGDAEVLTTMSWDDATYNSLKEFSKDDIKRFKFEYDLLKAKKAIGLSFEEIFLEKDLVSKLDIIKLQQRILDLNVGGGF